MSADWELQVALKTALDGDSGVQALLGAPPRIYDRPPDDVIFPYLTFGRWESRPADGDDVALIEHIFHLHVWSRYGGRAEARQTVGALRVATHNAQLVLPSHTLVNLRVTFTDVLRLPDGRTTQGVVRLRALTQTL